MHLIPADAAVARTLQTMRSGQIVRLGGYLVEVRVKDGWQCRGSLSRDDAGQGSCEVILVQTADVS